ncbi:helix-turn-helix transcriptional regulator [Spirochaetes bacterium]|uniref:Helix-turn-helix transcriptional regulator n=1 Tax=Candidatus Scatousia excrementipullorum TaxID=2840936 RepID=A0A9D9DRU1_9BACT|nr:helix-turn-helix transcriptional regulator [Candidatus Scatousia excrementipullorum]
MLLFLSQYSKGPLSTSDNKMACNIATRNLSNIETGRCFPSPENIEKIANALNCKIKDLFDFEHQQDNEDLYKGIVERIKPVSRDRLQDIYKITKALID